MAAGMTLEKFEKLKWAGVEKSALRNGYRHTHAYIM